MILAGQLLLCSDASARIAPGYLVVQEDRIAEVVEGEIPATADFGDANALITPGFIDTHLHLPQFDSIGAHGLPLLDWLQQVIFPAERKWEEPDFAAAMTRRVLNDCLSVGTTAIAAYATVHHQGAIEALTAATELGMRGVIGQVLMNEQCPDYLKRDAKQLIDEAAKTLIQFPPGKRISAAVTPRFAVSCSQELLSCAGDLATQHDAIVQTHLAETQRECDLVQELFDGQTYVDVYRSAGLLTAKSVFGHGIYLSEHEQQQLKNSRSIVAHCPTANWFLRSGTMNRANWLDAKIQISLGSDVGAGYERSMVRVGRSMIEAASSIGECYPSSEEAWFQITAGNADAMGWNDIGRLEAGNCADVVIIRPNIPWLGGNVSPLSMLMYAWDDRWIEEVFLQGRVAYQ